MPLARSGTRTDTRSDAARGGGGPLRPDLLPRNVFLVRLDGRVAALLVGRGGEVRVQDGPGSRWRLHRVRRVTRRMWPARLGLALDDGGTLRIGVYGEGDAASLQLGGTGLRGSARWRRLFAHRDRRRAARRLHGMVLGELR